MAFTPVESSLGGILLALSVNGHLLFHGKVTGMSGFVASVARFNKTLKEEWYLKASYIFGLIFGGFILSIIPEFSAQAFNPGQVVIQNEQWIYFVFCGILVGFGTQLGSGCTSGHMLCGLARLSQRSFIAVLSFCGTCFFFVKYYSTPQFIAKIYQIKIEKFSISYPSAERIIYMAGLVVLILAIYGLIIYFQDSFNKVVENEILHILNGFVFGVGLGFSGMTKPQKVLGFFDMGENWDPSLMCIIVFAILPSIWTFTHPEVKHNKRKPLFSSQFSLPTRSDINLPLIIGAILFGTGWGIFGLCPGPALVVLPTMKLPLFIYVGSIVIGIYLYDFYQSLISK
eukprot:gene378-6792_t